VNAVLAENGSEIRRATGTHLGRVMAVFSLLTLLAGAVWLMLGMGGGTNPEARALAVVSGSPHWQLLGWGLLVAFGISAIFGIYARNLWFGALLGLITLGGAWLLRWAVFIDGQLIPKTGAGFYDYALPQGPGGLLGIIGIFGLWLVVIIVESVVMRWNPDAATTPLSEIPAE